MSIRLTKRTGFCFGVKRAVEMAEEVLQTEGKAYSLGSIIHNAEVVKSLSRRGLKVIDKIDALTGGSVVISSHGISPHIADQIRKRSLKLADTTCPFVRNAQDMARSLARAGYKVIIVGDKNHPEVRALVDFADKKASVVKDVFGVKALRLKAGERVGILSQTTQSMDNFLSVVRAVIDRKPEELRIFNTICKDASERQAAARELAGSVDLMLIVGGRNSANTKRLYDVCKKVLGKSYLVQSPADLRDTWFKGTGSVGLTSGASTPEWIVKKVADKVNLKLRKKGRLQTLNG